MSEDPGLELLVSCDMTNDTAETNASSPLVGVVMGSQSDWPYIQPAAEILDEFEIPWERSVVSAHRTPEWLHRYGSTARGRGLKAIIASAAYAAALPGDMASVTALPVIGVPRPGKVLDGLDSLLSIVQMPKGIPVATMAIGENGAANAALLALRIIGTYDIDIGNRIEAYQRKLRDKVLDSPDPAGPDGWPSAYSSVISSNDIVN